MSALNGVYEALRPLGLYRLGQDSLVDRELAAYGAALEAFENAVETAARQHFVQTASGEALARYETLVGLAPRTGLDDETRRALVLYRLGVAPHDFHREGMLGSIRAAGMEAELGEDVEKEALTVRCLRVLDPSLDLDQLKESVRGVLPAHLLSEFDMGDLTWDLLESAAVTWDRWDETDLTWTDFDLNGHNIFIKEE